MIKDLRIHGFILSQLTPEIENNEQANTILLNHFLASFSNIPATPSITLLCTPDGTFHDSGSVCVLRHFPTLLLLLLLLLSCASGMWKFPDQDQTHSTAVTRATAVTMPDP